MAAASLLSTGQTIIALSHRCCCSRAAAFAPTVAVRGSSPGMAQSGRNADRHQFAAGELIKLQGLDFGGTQEEFATGADDLALTGRETGSATPP